MKIRVLLVGVLALAGCRKSDVPPESPASVEPVEEPVVVPVDPREDPDARGDDRVPEEPDPASLTACEAYARCCAGYATALATIEGVPESAIEATLEGCQAIQDLANQETGQESCAQALDALKQGVDALTSVPGFVPPAECY